MGLFTVLRCAAAPALAQGEPYPIAILRGDYPDPTILRDGKPVRLEIGRIDPGHAIGEDGRRYLILSAGGRVPLSADGLAVCGPWWSKGHGTIIDDVNGNWWIVYHAYENGYHTLGRQSLIEPIEWLPDGWFRAAKTAPPLPSGGGNTAGLKLSDDFLGKELGLQWTTWRDFDPKSITLTDGCLQLAAKGTTPRNARLLLVTATDHSYEVQAEVTLEDGVTGGLVLFYNEKAFAGLSSDGRQFTVYQTGTEASQQPGELGRHFL